MELKRYLDISQASDLRAFHQGLFRAAQDMGFGLFNAFLVHERPMGRKGPVLEAVDNVPAAYYPYSRDPAIVARDPLIRRLKRLSVPLTYDQRLYVADGAADIWERQVPYGYKCGVCVALHLPDHQHFVIGVDREAPLPKSENRLTRLMADLQLLAVHAEAAAHRLLLPMLQPFGVVAERRPALSSRETEILRWTMEGKTAWEVSVILGISQRSVVFHVGNAMRKLKSISKHQAVLRALQFGLI